MKSIVVDVVKETRNEGREYGLVKLSVGEKESFCVYIDGEEYACECVGDNGRKAIEIFDAIVANGVSSIHLFEILYDLRAEIYC